MLDVRGNCSILRRSCMTQPFVWRGSTRVLRRSFAGSRGSIYCLRGGEAMRGAGPCGLAGPFHQEAMWPSHCVARVHAGPAQGGSIVCVAARPSQAWGHAGPAQFPRVPRRSFHQEAMWPNCVAWVHAGPRRSEREGLESRVVGVRGNLRRV